MTALRDKQGSATSRVQRPTYGRLSNAKPDRAFGGSAVTRIAHCCCGSLRAEATGEPAFVGACHCTECQRCTGSPFGVPKEQVRTEGPSKVYVRGSDSGRKIEIHFCPDCGSSVFWHGELYPDLVGIAFGTFADRSMPWPTCPCGRRHGIPG
ncbi:GFA family protein [Bradyrhizobium sp. UFLA05-109]